MSTPPTTRRYPLPAVDAIPAELRERPQWVGWKYAGRDKLPVDIHNGRLAKVDTPATWSTFEQAYAYYAKRRGLGVGYVFTAEDPYVGVDFDGIRDPKTGEIAMPDFERITALNSYSEVSPSGTGVKVFVKAKLDRAHKKAGVEVYPYGRFFTVTGEILQGTPETIEDRQSELDALIASEFGSNGHRAEPIPETILDGQRNNTLVSLAGSLHQRGIAPAVIEAALLEVNASQCVPPLGEAEVRAIAASVARYPAGAAPTAPGHNPTDLGNAARLVEAHGLDLRYVPAWKTWLCWDGKRWKRDATNAVYRRAQDTVRGMYTAAGQIEDEAKRKAAVAWAMKTESRERLDAMIALARNDAEIVLTPEQLDADGWLLNCLNGTVELRTGELREHRREDLLSHLAPVEFTPKSSGSWREHITKVLPNGNVRRQVQRDMGRALVGATLEESLAIWHGTGANAKTTTARAVLSTLGDYADRAAPNLLIQSKHERHPTEIADLYGKRLVFSVEVDQGKQLAEALMKDLTGGDVKKARFMHQDFFSFEQTFSLVLIVNHKPVITTSDEGTWRRVRLIPWEYRIPENERRPQDEVLSELVADSGAILAWLADGLKDWQRDHTWIAPEVRALNEAYRAEMDVLGGFIEECCALGPRHNVAKASLYTAYECWCKDAGETAVTKMTFTQRLRQRGIADRKGTGGVREYMGIGLRVASSGTLSGNFSTRENQEKYTEHLPLVATNGKCDYFDGPCDSCDSQGECRGAA